MSTIVYGVIADARTLQRRRRLLMAAAVVAAVLLVGGAAAFVAAHRGDGRIVTLRVYSYDGTSVADLHRVVNVVRAEPGFRDVSTTTAAQGLARLRQKYPKLVATLKGNPLPDTLVVQVRTDAPAATVAARLEARLPGSRVRPVR